MAAIPYMQFYVSDYLSDTSHLSTIEHGAYLLLILSYWQKGESFKAKDQRTLSGRLATVARMPSDQWDAVEATLSEFFTVSETEWRHERIEKELNNVFLKSEQAKKAGLASYEKRLEKQQQSKKEEAKYPENKEYKEPEKKEIPPTSVQQPFNGRSTDVPTDVQPYSDIQITDIQITDKQIKEKDLSDKSDEDIKKISNADQNDNLGVSKPEMGKQMTGTLPDANPEAGSEKSARKAIAYSSDFEAAWKLYPKRLGDNPKQTAYDSWCARLKDGNTVEEMSSGITRYANFCTATGKVGTEAVKHASTFLGAKQKGFLEPWELPAYVPKINGSHGPPRPRGELPENSTYTPSYASPDWGYAAAIDGEVMK